MPRKAQTSSASGWLAVPQKILNLSSTRTRCGLRSDFSSGFTPGFFSVVVTRVAINRRWSFVVGRWPNPLALAVEANDKGRTTHDGFLAGPLGFEPRQRPPKALDLPLVDGPVTDCRVAISVCRLNTPALPAVSQSEIFNLKSAIASNTAAASR